MHSSISVFKTNFLSSDTNARVILNSHFFHFKNLLAERWKYHCSYQVKIINMSKDPSQYNEHPTARIREKRNAYKIWAGNDHLEDQE